MRTWSWLLAGMLMGAINLLLLRWTVDNLASTPVSRARAHVALSGTLRLAFVAGLLAFAALQGGREILLAFLGFWISRWSLLHWWSRASEAPYEKKDNAI